MPSLTGTIFDSSLSGLGNYSSKDASLSVPATSIAAFSYQDFQLNVAMDREDAISSVQIKYTGIENTWRPLSGRVLVYKPTFAGATDVFQCFGSFSGSTMTITVRVQNPTAGAKNCPAFTLDCRVFLYKAPFNE